MDVQTDQIEDESSHLYVDFHHNSSPLTPCLITQPDSLDEAFATISYWLAEGIGRVTVCFGDSLELEKDGLGVPTSEDPGAFFSKIAWVCQKNNVPLVVKVGVDRQGESITE